MLSMPAMNLDAKSAKRQKVKSLNALNTKEQTLNVEFKMKIPIVELSDCIKCGVCEEICPAVFRLNGAGFIDVIELSSYPEIEVNEAIKYCPADCIYWEE